MEGHAAPAREKTPLEKSVSEAHEMVMLLRKEREMYIQQIRIIDRGLAELVERVQQPHVEAEQERTTGHY